MIALLGLLEEVLVRVNTKTSSELLGISLCFFEEPRKLHWWKVMVTVIARVISDHSSAMRLAQMVIWNCLEVHLQKRSFHSNPWFRQHYQLQRNAKLLQ